MLPNTRKYRKLSSHKVLNESIEFWFQTLNQLLFFFFFHQSYFPKLRVSTCFMFVFTNYDIIEMPI